MAPPPTCIAALLLLLAAPLITVVRGQGFTPGHSSLNVLEPPCAAVGTGLVDDAPAIQQCIDLLPNDGGVIRFPRGMYHLRSALVLHQRQTRLVGDSYFAVLLIPDIELPNGTVSIRASDCEVNNVNVRTKGPEGVGIYVQGAAYAMVRNVQFLSDLNGNGFALVYDDRTAEGEPQPGSYTHTVENSYFGRPYRGAGTFNRSISTRGSQGGINACQIRGSHFIGDFAIDWGWGGGNFFTGNVFQSLSGTVHTPVGYAISLNFGGTATVNSNYVERYAAVVFANTTDRNPRDSACGTVALNEYDNNLAVYDFATNQSFSSVFAVDGDGIVSQALGGR